MGALYPLLPGVQKQLLLLPSTAYIAVSVVKAAEYNDDVV
jgi:hypothetical protein